MQDEVYDIHSLKELGFFKTTFNNLDVYVLHNAYTPIDPLWFYRDFEHYEDLCSLVLDILHNYANKINIKFINRIIYYRFLLDTGHSLVLDCEKYRSIDSYDFNVLYVRPFRYKDKVVIAKVTYRCVLYGYRVHNVVAIRTDSKFNDISDNNLLGPFKVKDNDVIDIISREIKGKYYLDKEVVLSREKFNKLVKRSRHQNAKV